jgi:release factor glutamine methyltransferase
LISLAEASPATLGAALRAGRERLDAGGIDEAQLESELLLRHALGFSREQLLRRLRDPIDQVVESARAGRSTHTQPALADAYSALLRRRLAHEPTPYITGRCEFHGLELACSPAALIPRPETELLVDRTLTWVEERQSKERQLHIADVGTGGGAIAVAVAVKTTNCCVVATDASREALNLAQRNVEQYGLTEQVTLVQADLLSCIQRPLDVIVANLPYVPLELRETLAPEIREYEPHSAVFAGKRGTELIERLLLQARNALARGGLLLAEHAWDQAERLRHIACETFPDARVETMRDFSGLERVLVVRRQARLRG